VLAEHSRLQSLIPPSLMIGRFGSASSLKRCAQVCQIGANFRNGLDHFVELQPEHCREPRGDRVPVRVKRDVATCVAPVRVELVFRANAEVAEAIRRLVDPRRARERVSGNAYATGFSNEKTFGRAF
jgi:hypothetical protein